MANAPPSIRARREDLCAPFQANLTEHRIDLKTPELPELLHANLLQITRTLDNDKAPFAKFEADQCCIQKG